VPGHLRPDLVPQRFARMKRLVEQGGSSSNLTQTERSGAELMQRPRLARSILKPASGLQAPFQHLLPERPVPDERDRSLHGSH
jgi:hypothetical protein